MSCRLSHSNVLYKESMEKPTFTIFLQYTSIPVAGSAHSVYCIMYCTKSFIIHPLLLWIKRKNESRTSRPRKNAVLIKLGQLKWHHSLMRPDEYHQQVIIGVMLNSIAHHSNDHRVVFILFSTFSQRLPAKLRCVTLTS